MHSRHFTGRRHGGSVATRLRHASERRRSEARPPVLPSPARPPSRRVHVHRSHPSRACLFDSEPEAQRHEGIEARAVNAAQPRMSSSRAGRPPPRPVASKAILVVTPQMHNATARVQRRMPPRVLTAAAAPSASNQRARSAGTRARLRQSASPSRQPTAGSLAEQLERLTHSGWLQRDGGIRAARRRAQSPQQERPWPQTSDDQQWRCSRRRR